MCGRRVSFGDASELFEAFTPYCKKYGAHPDDFYFDSKGHMVLVASTQSDVDVLDIKVNDAIECILEMGVQHYEEPESKVRLDKLPNVVMGETFIVKKRCGNWVHDNVGWLPLLIRDNACFQVVVPEDKLRYATARVPVMSVCEEE